VQWNSDIGLVFPVPRYHADIDGWLSLESPTISTHPRPSAVKTIWCLFLFHLQRKVNVTATFDGAATADYLLQTTEDLVSSNWNTVGEFTSDTNFVLAATNSQGFYRTVGE